MWKRTVGVCVAAEAAEGHKVSSTIPLWMRVLGVWVWGLRTVRVWVRRLWVLVRGLHEARV